ncbi:28S ribosomal protein S10, mitochondrial [Polyrhizophydium stewartii]|uniref:28S ribosomal protein S10, mitochondrial n=1 Tax=Polyrhizophydium stewartii TaxID=2732419 RepID=A0ABR4NKV0_9FUNG
MLVVATTKSLDVPPIAEPKRTHNQLVCNLELSGFMPDHLDFVAYFARHAAKALKMPTSDTIHLKTAINRWFTNKGPFVHAKTKEIFERKTYHRLIQAFDASPETITAWVKYVNESLPPGVDLKVERFEWEPLGFGKALPEPKIEGQKTHVEEVRERAAQYLAQFTKK